MNTKSLPWIVLAIIAFAAFASAELEELVHSVWIVGTSITVLGRPPRVPGTLRVIETDPQVFRLWNKLVVQPVGDLDGDGFVGIDDLNIVLGNWNANVTPGDPLQGDPSGDGFVGIEDLNAVLGTWNNGTPPTAGSAVPEPAAAILLSAGGLAVLGRRRHDMNC